jgi:dienelactone hydrolase
MSFVPFSVYGEDLNAPSEKIGVGKPEAMMRRYLLTQVEQAGHRWMKDYEKLKTPEQIAAYQKRLREKTLEAIGGLPERTPLNPQRVGEVARPGYRVEKILFESQPKHFVTALLFLPDARKFKSPYPGVIVPCGHSLNGKGHDAYQTMGALLALNGLVGLVYDPIDQGERGQYLGQGGWPKLHTTSGHTMVGVGSILLGQNTARFEIWDGMRAIDYLQSRPEVDPNRIGCTGNSGGGTQTSYLMALDERIHAAAPSCYITSMTKLLKTIGPQDAEQNIFGQLAFGLDHADWIMLRAPSPVLLCAATDDFFDISGSWDSFRCAKRLYTRIGCSDRVDLLENDAAHNYNEIQRAGAAQWLSRWLRGKDLTIAQPQIALLSAKEYQCTTDGKTMTLPGARSVYDLNEDRENALAKQRATAWTTGDKASLLGQVRRLTGVRHLSELPQPKSESLGTIARAGYTIEKLVICPEPGIAIPALWFSPQNDKPRGVALYIHEQGKAADAGIGGPIERLVTAGKAVLSVDLRGTGQTQATLSADGGYSPEYQDAAMAYLLSRSYVGMRTEDVWVCARFAAQRGALDGRESPVHLIAVGHVGIPALHAAALEPAIFAKVEISHMLGSWATILHERLSKNQMPNVVHGALKCYDLPNLIATLGDKISVSHPVDAMGKAVK